VRAVLVASATLVLTVAGCRGQTSSEPPIVPFRGMHEMPRYDAQERAAYFADGRAMRQQVDGTLSREMEPNLEIDSGLDDEGNYLLGVPSDVVSRVGGVGPLLERGQQRYNIYCAPCHSETGDGQGMVSQRAASAGLSFPAANLHDAQFLHMPDGRLFLTISNGVRTMPAYRAQIPVNDRWAIAAYVRALQVSQGDAAAGLVDTDRDQLPAGADRCENEPEDRDGYQDDDGCPDPDNDQDGILDAADMCPFSAGPAATTGCAGSARIEGDHLVLLNNVRFANGRERIKPESLAILDEIRATLIAHPEITRVAIEGNTDNRGSAAVNQALSERRARVVLQWLVEHGVEASRLESAGFGPSRPITTNDTPAGRQANRRVELRIVAPAAVPAPGGV
jgi:outer membrane protein OmpA-like peptidoglycan-associated protein